MDFTQILSWLPLILRVINVVPIVQEEIGAGGSVIDKIKSIAPTVLPLVEAIGKALFPTVTGPNVVLAGADVLFDPTGVKWTQNAVNKFNKNTTLLVDGIYGNATKDVVKAYQTNHVDSSGKPLDVDGWCGKKTRASLTTELDKLPVVA